MNRKVTCCVIGALIGTTFLFGLKSFLQENKAEKLQDKGGYQVWEVVDDDGNFNENSEDSLNSNEKVIEYNNENNTKIILKDGEKSLEKRKKSVSSQSSKINKSSTKSSSKTSSTKNISSSKTSSKPDKSDNKNDDKKEFTGIININTATAEELCLLENIGESRAKAIIDFRNKCGGFTDIEEIKAVYGIGDKIFLKIKDKIKI